jgi:thiamine biosynthesis protein ThiC
MDKNHLDGMSIISDSLKLIDDSVNESHEQNKKEIEKYAPLVGYLRKNGFESDSIDPETARSIREDRSPEFDDTCSMCGKFCAVRSMNKALNGEYIDIL